MDIVGEDSSEAELGGRKKRKNVMSNFYEFPEEQNNINSDESEGKGFRMDDTPTYDDTVDIDYFEASGTYSLDLIRQRRVLRHKRSAAVNHLELPEAMESTLTASIDLSEYSLREYRIHSAYLRTIFKNHTLCGMCTHHEQYLWKPVSAPCS